MNPADYGQNKKQVNMDYASLKGDVVRLRFTALHRLVKQSGIPGHFDKTKSFHDKQVTNFIVINAGPYYFDRSDGVGVKFGEFQDVNVDVMFHEEVR